MAWSDNNHFLPSLRQTTMITTPMEPHQISHSNPQHPLDISRPYDFVEVKLSTSWRKRIRENEDASPPSKRTRHENDLDQKQQELVTQRTYDLLCATLSKEFLLDLQCPSAQDLKFEVPKIDVEQAEGKFFDMIDPSTNFLRALWNEYTEKSKYPALTAPSADTILDAFFKHPEAYRVRRMLTDGPLTENSAHEVPCKGPDQQFPYQNAVAKAVMMFGEKVLKHNQQLNVIATICSPSTYLYGLLHHKCDETLWRNEVAREYLNSHPYILFFHREVVELALPEVEIYQLISPLFPHN